MDDPQVGIAIVSILTFMGCAQWLYEASWRGSPIRSAILIFCASVQIVTAFFAIKHSAMMVLVSSLLVLIGYAVATYIGAEREVKNGNA